MHKSVPLAGTIFSRKQRGSEDPRTAFSRVPRLVAFLCRRPTRIDDVALVCVSFVLSLLLPCLCLLFSFRVFVCLCDFFPVFRILFFYIFISFFTGYYYSSTGSLFTLRPRVLGMGLMCQ